MLKNSPKEAKPEARMETGTPNHTIRRAGIFLRQIPAALLLALVSFLFQQCRLENERLDPSPASGLSFSVDTLEFDTVFTDMQTVTIRMRVYNENDRAINLRSVYIGGRNGQTPFTFSINGRKGPTRVTNVGLEGKDSAYVLVSARIDSRNQNNPFIIEDSLVFEIEGRSKIQHVPIRAYGQDALYLKNHTITENTIWKAGRPIILMDSVSLARGKVLTIEPGARIYGYNFSYLIVRGELECRGTRDKPVIFQGTRLENYYSDVPGQWIGILIMDGGTADVDYTTVKNSLRGFQVGEVGNFPAGITRQAFLQIRNSRIENVVDYGILGLKSVVLAINNQIADCGEGGFGGLQGGTYELWHNTFGFSGNNPFRREDKFQWSFADNFSDGRTGFRYVFPLSVKAVNNVVNGSEDEEIGIGEKRGEQPLRLVFLHNLLKSANADFFREQGPLRGNRRLPQEFRFLRPLRYEFAPDTTENGAAALGLGLSLDTVTSGLQGLAPDLLRTFLSTDISGKNRPSGPGSRPDAGAYNRLK